MTAVLKAAQAVAAQASFIEIEVETLEQLTEALDAGAKMVLLDNMPLPMLREAVRQRGPRDSRNLWRRDAGRSARAGRNRRGPHLHRHADQRT